MTTLGRSLVEWLSALIQMINPATRSFNSKSYAASQLTFLNY